MRLGTVRRHVVASGLGTALLLTGLAGCSEPQQASTALPPTSTAPTPTEDALPPLGPPEFPVPIEARTQDAAGAEAFLRYWIDLINRQRAIPAGQPIRDLGPDCQECLRIARNYDEAADLGQQYQGGELTLNDVTEPQIEGDEASINFAVRREAVALVDADGKPVVEGQDVAPNLGSGIALLWSTSTQSWVVEGFNIG